MTVAARTHILVLIPAIVLAGCGLLSDPPPPPAAPTQLVVEPASTRSIQLSWMASGDPGEFRLERARDDSTFQEVAVLDGGSRSYLDTGLAEDERYRYRLQACGEGGCSEPVTGEASTYAPLTIATGSLRPGFVGVPYSEAVNAAGGDGDYDWSVESGSFPPGLALDDATGLITGTPDTAGRFTFTLAVRDAGGRTASQSYTVQILATPPAVSIENYVLPPVVEGGAYRVQLVGNGGDGQSYAWAVVGGALPPGLQLAADGTIQGTATMAGSYPVTFRVTSAGQSSTETFTIRVVPDDPTAFRITTFPVVPVPASIQPHVDSAVARWEAAVTGNLTTVSIPAGFFGASGCGGFGDAVNGTTTDDVIMIIDIAPIDGPGQVLGRAGPCGLRSASSVNASLPFVGVLTLDSEDLTPIAGSSTLTDIVFHEMGHVLGFGTLWESFDLLLSPGTADPRYTGANAVAEWQALGRTGDVPVANTGGAGTEDAHWRESVFDREIMTGFTEAVGIDQPLSRVSIAAMADLGYEVDLAAADSYSLLRALRSDGTAGTLGRDVILDGPILVLEPGGGRSVIER